MVKLSDPSTEQSGCVMNISSKIKNSKMTLSEAQENFVCFPVEGRVFRLIGNKLYHAARISNQRRAVIYFRGRAYLVSNLVWLFVYGRYPLPGKELDHINRDKLDDRIENLREVTHTENMQNKFPPKLYGSLEQRYGLAK